MTPRTWTSKDTGVVLNIRKVSPLLVTQLHKSFPPPKPPINTVDYGDGKKVFEENVADPDYQKALEQYNLDQEIRFRHLLIQRGVVDTMTDENKREVESMREFWKTTYGEELKGSDLEIFVSYIALGSPEDLEELTEAIMRRGQPTPAAMEEADKRFPS